MFKAKQAVRNKVFVKVALMAPSGGGKTFSSLRVATGMAQEIEKREGRKARILLGNTEGDRGYYYANEFDYEIVDLDPPYTPEKFTSFLHWAEEEKYDIVILDSASHEWEGRGGCLEIHAKAGGRYQDWKDVTPRHEKFIDAMSKTKINLIATMRGKDKYELEKDDNGKTSVNKLGVGAKQREGFEFEFTCTFMIDQKTNFATYQKDNTHIFENEISVLLTEEHGRKLIQWANSDSGKNIEMLGRTEEKTELKPVKAEPKPIVEEKPPVQEETTEPKIDFKKFKKDLITLCKAKAKIKEIGGNGISEKVEEYLGEGNTLNDAGEDMLDKLIELQKAIEALK